MNSKKGELISDLARLERRCQRAARVFETDPVSAMGRRLLDACQSVGQAWSGSWLGYQASVYKDDLQPREPGEHFQAGYRYDQTGEWSEFSYEAVKGEILNRASVTDTQPLEDVAKKTVKAFEDCKRELLPTLEAMAASISSDATLTRLGDDVRSLEPYLPQSKILRAQCPQSGFTEDLTALQGGFCAPHHLRFQAWVMQQLSYGDQVGKLGELAGHAAVYVRRQRHSGARLLPKDSGTVFIGHGHATDWRELKDFLVGRLNLDYEEFNRKPVAGLSNKERLEEMLTKCSFAFLVMTAEEDRGEGRRHARDNVIHEVGLFQGRYGFERAIVLLEEGCEEFSNLEGIGQIRFPGGRLTSAFEEIRRVLEREGMISKAHSRSNSDG